MSYIVSIGEIMLRLSSLSNERLLQTAKLNATVGGAEANVCVSLARFGLKSRYVTALPDNAIGRKIEEILLANRVDTSCILWEGNRVGLYFLDMGCDNRQSSIIYDREHSSISEVDYKKFNWNKIFEDAKYFHITGITPGISEKALNLIVYAVSEAKKRNIKISCDINYRSKLWKYGKHISDVMPNIVENVNILFANEYDAINILGINSNLDINKYIEDKDYIELMTSLSKKYNIDTIITTKREVINVSHNRYSAKLLHNFKLYKSREYDIKNIVDRVGTGDAFVSGILAGFYLFNDIQETLNFATASATIKHTIYGDLNLVTKDEILNFMKNSNMDVSR